MDRPRIENYKNEEGKINWNQTVSYINDLNQYVNSIEDQMKLKDDLIKSQHNLLHGLNEVTVDDITVDKEIINSELYDSDIESINYKEITRLPPMEYAEQKYPKGTKFECIFGEGEKESSGHFHEDEDGIHDGSSYLYYKGFWATTI